MIGLDNFNKGAKNPMDPLVEWPGVRKGDLASRNVTQCTAFLFD